jgi:hypothetical protein
MMEVTYTTTLDDYIAWNMHMFKRSSSMRRRYLLGWATIPIGCATMAIVLAELALLPAIAFGLIGVLHAVLYPFLYRYQVESAIEAYANEHSSRGVIGRTTLILTEDTLTEQTASVRSVVRWQDMKGVEEVGDCTYIYITGLLAAIVPRRGFERAEDYEALRDFAIAKLGTMDKP